MNEKNKNQKNESIIDLKYYLIAEKKGYLWWKKPIYKTGIGIIIRNYKTININYVAPSLGIQEIEDIDNQIKASIQAYIDNKLEELDIFSKNIIPDIYAINVSSKWSNEELDKAIDNFVNKVIKYKF